MLTRLEIRNLAVIEHVVFCPSQGLNVISGETGAGKSLLIDAIELIFGQKASKDLIRNDCDSASVEAVFDLEPLTEKRLKPVMDEYGIPIEDGQIIISRIFKEEGKSTARINGTGVVLSQLRRISSELIDIHGQNDNSRLFDPALHITMLDSYGGKKIDELLSSYRNKLQEYKDLASEYTEVNKLASSSSSRIEYLTYALKEIREADIKPGEDETLLLRKKELSNLARDKALIDDVNKLTSGADNSGLTPSGRLSEALRTLTRLASKDDSYSEYVSRLESISLDLDAFVSDFQDKTSDSAFSEDEEHMVADRLSKIFELESKYGKTIDEVNDFADKAQKELSDIEEAGIKSNELKKRLNTVKDELLELAGQLSDERKKLADKMSSEITNELIDLEMPSSSFSVRFDTRPKDRYFNINGIDDVRFMFTANPGQPPMDLAATASGGEASRIMLAIKNILSSADTMPTLIFDEIDTGVSGRASLAIAGKLRSISKEHQVLCVSHTAQLASAADAGFLIEKKTDGISTHTDITLLSDEERVKEVSRLLSGKDDTESNGLARKMIEELRT